MQRKLGILETPIKALIIILHGKVVNEWTVYGYTKERRL